MGIDPVVTFSFISVEADITAIVREVEPFVTYNRDNDNWSEINYIGPNNIALNNTDCKGALVSKVTDTGFSLESCLTSPSVGILTKVIERYWKKEYYENHFTPKIQTKIHNDRIHIMCFGAHIRVDQQEQECPSYVFSLPTSVSFHIRGINFSHKGYSSSLTTSSTSPQERALMEEAMTFIAPEYSFSKTLEPLSIPTKQRTYQEEQWYDNILIKLAAPVFGTVSACIFIKLASSIWLKRKKFGRSKKQQRRQNHAMAVFEHIDDNILNQQNTGPPRPRIEYSKPKPSIFLTPANQKPIFRDPKDFYLN